MDRGLDVIAISDHNSIGNVKAVREAAGRMAGEENLTVLGGMEITTMEEIHLLAVFDTEENVCSMQELIYENLPGENNPDFFGPQYIVDSEDYVEDTDSHLLIGATTLSLERTIEEAHERSGLVIAAHIDRESFSLISQLGFIPPDLELDAVEFSPYYKKNRVDPAEMNYPYTFFSDAHQPDDIGKVYTIFYIENPTVEEIKKALQEAEGRRVVF